MYILHIQKYILFFWLLLLFVGCSDMLRASPGEIRFSRSGGFRGADDTLVLSAPDRAVLIRAGNKHEFNIDSSVVQDFQQRLEKIHFKELDANYMLDDTCCDLIEYTITYNGHTVKTMDTAIPNDLQQIIDDLNQIINAAPSNFTQ